MRMMTGTMMMIMISMMTMININFAKFTRAPSVGLRNYFCFTLKGSCRLWNAACCLSLNVVKYIFASQTVCWCFGHWLVWQTFFPVDYSGGVIWDASFASLSHPYHQYYPPHPPPHHHPQSVREGVKLHINVYWLPTVSNKKWDLLGQKARGPSIYSKSEPKLSKAPPTGDLFASRLPFSDLIGFSSSTLYPTLFCFTHLTVESSPNGLM